MKKISLLVLSVFTCISLAAQTVNTNNAAEPVMEPLEVAKTFFTAYQNGEHEKFSSLLHPDVVWIQPGDNRISGVKKSKAELLKMGAAMSEISARTIKLTTVKMYAVNGNTVACVVNWQAAQPTGNLLNVNNVDLFTIEGGKIISGKVFSEDLNQENKFWGR